LGGEEHELAGLIDLERVERLCESLSEAFGFALAVLDRRGDVLVATGWQEICTRFHRENAETLQGCLESDLSINRRLVEGLDASEHYAYRCRNGLWDVAFPLVVAGEHLANVYTGQFLFEDDAVDREEFAARARRLGFDEDAYLAALDRVPVISHEHLRRTITFLGDFVSMLGEMGLNALERERRHAELKKSEERYRRLFDSSTEGIVVFRAGHGEDDAENDVVLVDVNPVQEARTGAGKGELVGRRLRDLDEDERLHAYFEAVASAIEAGQATRSEICLSTSGVSELLSVSPAGGDLWLLSATDVSELRKAEEALRSQEEGIRRAYVDVLDAVTGGKLILLTESELQDELGAPLMDPITFGAPAELAAVRRTLVRTAEHGFSGRIPRTDLLSTVGEALDNAIKHAGGGTCQVFAREASLQVAVADEGPGIDFRTLPRATLVPGFSTAASLGMGFTIMLQLCERVLLATRPGKTVVTLEFAAAEEAALVAPAQRAGLTRR
jgi:ligand-binding sensor protein/anti-sigma regulatory factor (Ser/Thr protein kinase)